ncbi:MAG: hypothetical protein QOG53_2305 [Frankiales bacterium]|jgi:hypothetical protein|nr:hypothetical protein [Frankiales bacterium]
MAVGWAALGLLCLVGLAYLMGWGLFGSLILFAGGSPMALGFVLLLTPVLFVLLVASVCVSIGTGVAASFRARSYGWGTRAFTWTASTIAIGTILVGTVSLFRHA